MAIVTLSEMVACQPLQYTTTTGGLIPVLTWNRCFLTPLLGNALLVVTVVAAENEPLRWSDGMFQYKTVLPVAGYIVPQTVFKESYRTALAKVLAEGRKMTAEQLKKYSNGDGGLKVSLDFPLFVFNNQGANVFLWKGKHDGDQQIIPRVWNGNDWDGLGCVESRADAIECLFFQPVNRDLFYVMVEQQNGQVGRQRIHTDRVSFGKFPGVEAVLKKGLQTADTVVYVPFPKERAKEELVDCLKGTISGPAFQKIPGVSAVHYDSLVFLAKMGEERRIQFSYGYGFGFHNKYGELRIEYHGNSDAARLLDRYSTSGHVRWLLSRQGTKLQKGVQATLTLANPRARRGDWLILELVVGVDEPGPLFRMPLMRHQRDGGDPLFSFKVRQAKQEATLTPRGRFGAASFTAREPQQNAALRFEYRFIDWGPGIVKLAIRPKGYPWKVEVLAFYRELVNPFQNPNPALTTMPVTLNQD